MRPQERKRDLIIAGIATIYTIFLLYAGGMKFIVLSAVLYAPGTALYFWARREQGKPVFTNVGLGHLHPGGHRRRRRHLWLATGYITI